MTDNFAEVMAQLTARLEALEQRVLELEHPSAVLATATVAKRALDPGPVPAVEAGPVATAGGMFAVLGKALLGIAGAFLLRALVEAGTFPKLVVVLAVLYAGAWLVGATRVRREYVFAGAVFSVTSALIFAPMLSELTLRFHLLSPPMSAAMLVVFAIGALALTWKNSFAAVFWVGYATSLLMALILMIATQALIPFLCAILVIAFASELAACVEHALNGRTLTWVVADAAVAALLYIYSLPEGARTGYGSVSAATLVAVAAVPFLLSVASTTLQTVRRRRRITVGERVEIILAFGFAAFAAMTFGEGTHRVAFGLACIAIAAVGYALAFYCFRDESEAPNFHAYTTGSAALLLVGGYASLPRLGFVLALGIAAVVTTGVGAQLLQAALEFEGAAFLLAATAVSGLFGFDVGALVGSQDRDLNWIFALLLLCALVCYGLASRRTKPGWTAWIPNMLAATIAAATAAAFVMLALAKLLGRALGETPAVWPLEFLQTLVLCAMALGLALGGSLWRRQELAWLAYAALVATAAKILLEDVRHGHLIVIAASFFLYAATLIVLPRLAGHGHREPVQPEV